MKSISKKIIFISILVFSFSIFELTAQTSVNTNDKFYEEAQSWYLRGLVKKDLPSLRPYPLNTISEILNDVIEIGTNNGEKNASDVETAKEEYERIFGKKWKFYLNGGADVKVSKAKYENETSSSKTKNLEGEIGFQGDIKFHDLVGFGYNIGFYGETKDFEKWSPLYTNILQDSIYDAATVSKFSVYNNWNTNVQFGKSDIYATAGVSRIGFGDFYGDSLSLNDNGYHSANIVFNITRDKWSYASVLESIGATSNLHKENLNLNSGKYLAFHTIKFHATKKFDISYYENVLFGSNFNFAYLFPAPYMAIQNIGGANDNLQMGFLFDYKIISGLLWSTDLFIDDFAVDEVAKLDFDSKLRFGFQTGLIYTPENSTFNKISLNYQVVMPYVYSHWEYENSSSGFFDGNTVNYQNYMNAGVHIGSVLDPNSDKISFNAKFNPTKKLSLDFSTSFIRHANSAEAFSEEDAFEYVLSKANTYSTDGTAYMHQMFSDENGTSGNHVSQAWDCLGFMTSEHKMYVTQAGLSSQYDFSKTKAGQFSVKFGYTFEYVKNAGVNSNIYNGLGDTYSYNEENKTHNFNGKANLSEDDFKEEVKSVINQQKQDWINNLYDEVNHYLSVSVKYQY